MIAHADDGKPSLRQLPDTLAEQLAAISVTPEHHDALVEAVTGRLRNPTDHIGRTAHEIALMREAGYAITPTPECVGCGNRLVFISGTDDGDRRKTPHLRHPSRSSCPGGFVTPWHVAMQKAAKAAGFTTEHTVSVLGRIRRLDAYSESCRVALEFVHSLSDSYIEKHRDLVASGDSVRWVFNSAASFTTPLRNEFVHLPSLREGRIVLGGLLRPSAIKLIESLGYRNVFMWYRSVILGCVGVDLWSPVPADHPLALLCRREQGFNDQLFRMGRTFKRALDGTVTGDHRIVRARFPITSEFTYDTEHFATDVRGELCRGDYRATPAPAVGDQGYERKAGSNPNAHVMPSGDASVILPCEGGRAAATNNVPLKEAVEILESTAATCEAAAILEGEDRHEWQPVVATAEPTSDDLSWLASKHGDGGAFKIEDGRIAKAEETITPPVVAQAADPFESCTQVQDSSQQADEPHEEPVAPPRPPRPAIVLVSEPKPRKRLSEVFEPEESAVVAAIQARKPVDDVVVEIESASWADEARTALRMYVTPEGGTSSSFHQQLVCRTDYRQLCAAAGVTREQVAADGSVIVGCQVRCDFAQLSPHYYGPTNWRPLTTTTETST